MLASSGAQVRIGGRAVGVGVIDAYLFLRPKAAPPAPPAAAEEESGRAHRHRHRRHPRNPRAHERRRRSPSYSSASQAPEECLDSGFGVDSFFCLCFRQRAFRSQQHCFFVWLRRQRAGMHGDADADSQLRRLQTIFPGSGLTVDGFWGLGLGFV
jgi:hypothetical protein